MVQTLSLFWLFSLSFLLSHFFFSSSFALLRAEKASVLEALNPGQAFCIDTGEKALAFFALGDTSVKENILYTLIVIVFFRALQYVLLRVSNQRPE